MLHLTNLDGKKSGWASSPFQHLLGDCQNYGPFLGPYYNTGPNTGPNLGDPKRDHNFDNPPIVGFRAWGFRGLGTGIRVLSPFRHLSAQAWIRQLRFRAGINTTHRTAGLDLVFRA